MQFTPLMDFYSEELQSGYCVGLSYTAQPEDKALMDLLPEWVLQWKIRPGSPDVSESIARVSGVGTAQ